MPATPAGRLRTRLTYQRGTATRGPLGVAVPTWADFGRDRAKVTWGAASERAAAASVEQAVQTATFRVRSSALARSVTVQDRIVAGGLTWDIAAIAPIDCNPAEIEFTATASRG